MRPDRPPNDVRIRGPENLRDKAKSGVKISPVPIDSGGVGDTLGPQTVLSLARAGRIRAGPVSECGD
jgi:hypothetical protein